jgi:hypothetical protein
VIAEGGCGGLEQNKKTVKKRGPSTFFFCTIGSGIVSSSRIHRSLTGGKSQLLLRVVIPARQATWLAGWYYNPMPELTLSSSQGSMNSATVFKGRIPVCKSQDHMKKSRGRYM